MAEDNSSKCTNFNSWYCKFTRKKNGCRYLHPAESCQVLKCRDKECPLRHQKICKHGDQCRQGAWTTMQMIMHIKQDY